jgi:8-oxo-dGTP diphosphatase
LRAVTTVGVFAAIFDEDRRILCVRRAYAPHNWTLPGGRVEENESPIEALVRAVAEATGCDVDPGDLVGVYAAPFKDDLVLFFECTLRSRGEWRPDAEIAEVSFMPADALPDDLTSRTRARIADAFSGVRGVVRVFVDDAPSVEVGGISAIPKRIG